MLHRGRRIASLIFIAISIGLATQNVASKPAPASPRPTVTATTDTPAEAPATREPSVIQAVAGLQPGLAHVVQTIDGDTIIVKIGERTETVRFIGADTPETHDPRKPVQCFGETAAAHTKALLAGQDVRLAPDPQDSDRDKYGRLLRYVYLPNGTFINAQLIQDGYGFAYVVFPFSKLDEFRSLEAQARSANRGLWAGCQVDESQLIKQTAGAK